MLVSDARESAARLLALLFGDEGGLARETLLANAAVAAWTQGRATSIDEGKALATDALDSGRALAVLRKWQEFSKKA
jgi:anthranilate phosphoribosyltransferase